MHPSVIRQCLGLETRYAPWLQENHKDRQVSLHSYPLRSGVARWKAELIRVQASQWLITLKRLRTDNMG
jgi:hypothetical protein